MHQGVALPCNALLHKTVVIYLKNIFLFKCRIERAAPIAVLF